MAKLFTIKCFFCNTYFKSESIMSKFCHKCNNFFEEQGIKNTYRTMFIKGYRFAKEEKN